MRYGRHPKWDEIDKLLDKITDHLGHSIYDNRCGKSWDVGQAVCAEAYGPNWMKNPTFREWDQLPDTDSPEPYYYECAVKMANGYIPEWTKEAT